MYKNFFEFSQKYLLTFFQIYDILYMNLKKGSVKNE